MPLGTTIKLYLTENAEEVETRAEKLNEEKSMNNVMKSLTYNKVE